VKVTIVKILIGVALCLCAASLPAGAQPADKIARIGFLGFGGRGPYHQVFEQALGERGWVTGKNLVIVYRHAEERYDRLPGLAAELVRLGRR
jgi:putative ABC transport system substrate-binding protein